MNSNEIFILIGVFGLGFFLGNGVLDEPKITIKVPTIQKIDTRDFLTVDDLRSIYSCVDTKITNKTNNAKFPCIKVRGDSF